MPQIQLTLPDGKKKTLNCQNTTTVRTLCKIVAHEYGCDADEISMTCHGFMASPDDDLDDLRSEYHDGIELEAYFC